MPATDKFFAINIRKYLALGDDQEAGEPALVKLLSGFSCPKKPDLERFLKKVQKSKKKRIERTPCIVFNHTLLKPQINNRKNRVCTKTHILDSSI